MSYEKCAEALIDNIQKKRFGISKAESELLSWQMQQAFVMSWDENSNTKYKVTTKYFDVEKNEITKSEAENLDFYYKRIKITEYEDGIKK